jgi:vancomycin resistance protein YoaR
MAAYRRQTYLTQLFALLLIASLNVLSATPLLRQGITWPLLWPQVESPAAPAPLVRPALSAEPAIIEAPAPAAIDESARAAAVPIPPIAAGSASIGGIGDAALTNIQIAISFLDGSVIEPGDELSFDDVAHTWDYHEDPIYLMGTATSVYGVIDMRGGGVCWVSTALWRAALAAGIRTDLRDEHYGLVNALGPGVDATNTLVIRNDSDQSITVRAWLDDEAVIVALFTDEPLDRTATIRGPESLGRGQYIVYQDVDWADGRSMTSSFYSRYYW